MDIKPDSIFYLAFFILTALALLCVSFWMVRTEKRLKKFFLGKKAKDLEENITTLEKSVNELEAAKIKSEKELATINKKIRRSVRGLETIRFNPFPDQGGNQSFALGLFY